MYATLVFAGVVFEAVTWYSGYRQGGPLSALVFILVVHPFLVALSMINGVRKVFGFCDDWEVSMVGLRPARAVRHLVVEFD